MIDNIVINAQQAMPTGGVVEVVGENVEYGENRPQLLAPGKYVKLSIKDAGIGISREIQPRIFEPFFTTKTKGNGLGLATCYSILKRHGGSIEVSSEPEKGSTFTLYLPAADGELPVQRADHFLHRGSGLFIVADDEEVMRKMIGEMLFSMGYAVELREDCRRAIDCFAESTQKGKPCAGLIFDLTIPGGMGGLKAVREIRKRYEDIPVFAVSGYADDPVMVQPEEFGFNGSLSKPFTRMELSELLIRKMPRSS